MCTISTCLSTSRSGSPISRMVTSQPPHMANHSSASRAAMLHLPTGLELVVLRSLPPQSGICVRYVRQQTEAAGFSRRDADVNAPAFMVQPAHHVSDSRHPLSRHSNVPLECAAGLERVAVFLEGESAMVPP